MVENFGGVGGRGNYRGGRAVETTLGLSQRLELGGKRDARVGLAGRTGDVAALDHEAARLDLARDVVSALADAEAAFRTIAVERDRARLAAETLRIARGKVDAGKEPLLQARRAEVTRATADVAVEKASLDAEAALHALALLIGVPRVELASRRTWFDDVGVAPAPPLPADPLLRVAANPDFLKLDAAIAQQRANISVQRANAVPDVTLQGYVRRFEEGRETAFVAGASIPLPFNDRNQAESAREMIRPSLFGQAIIILVYAPLLTFTGVEGKMFGPMALTVIIALVFAFVLSLTLVPALIAIAITGRVKEEEVWLVRALKRGYAPALRGSLRAPVPIIAGGAVLFALSLTLFGRLGQEFIPTLDEGNVAMHVLRIPSTSMAQSQAMQSAVEKRVSAFKEVAFIFSKTGTAEVASDPMPPSASDTFIILRPRAEWPDPTLPKDELVKRIEQSVSRLPGNALEFTQPIQMRFNELLAGVRGDLAVKVFGDETGPMLRAANQIAAILNRIEGASDVKVEQAQGLPYLEITVDRAEIARRGLSVAAVQDVVSAAVGGKEAGAVFEGDRRFAIVVRLAEAVRSDMEALQNLPVPLPVVEGRPMATVPLRQVASLKVVEGPNQISRENGKRRVVVQANARGRDIGSIVAEARAKVDAEVRLPPGYTIAWGGQFENLAAAQARLQVVVPACFLLIVLLLYAALGRFRDALLVFSGVPLALTGGLLALWLRDMPFSVSAAVGFIALSGVAVLNGLVMASAIRGLLEAGRLPLRDAVFQGAMTRLRPVAMTALVASLGFVPMALATGPGAEVQKPLATVVIGGLVSATLLTLLVLPALYMRFNRSAVPARDARVPDGQHTAAE